VLVLPEELLGSLPGADHLLELGLVALGHALKRAARRGSARSDLVKQRC